MMHRMHARPLYAPAADSHDGVHVHAAGNGIDDVCPASAANSLNSLCSPHATLRYPARDETSKATPSAAELEIMIRPGYCRHRRQRACPAEVPYCCTSLAHIVHVRLRPRPEVTRHDTTRSAPPSVSTRVSLQAKVGVGSGSSHCTTSSSRGPHPCLAPCTSTRRLPP